jgi:hypothetical protein
MGESIFAGNVAEEDITREGRVAFRERKRGYHCPDVK